MQVEGEIRAIMDTRKVNDKLSKREFVVDYVWARPKGEPISFTLINKNCNLLDGYKKGDWVAVDFRILGRQAQLPQGTKYFNTLEVWRISKINK